MGFQFSQHNQPLANMIQIMLLGGVMLMTCFTKSASTPIPIAEVANNTFIRECLSFLSLQ